MSMFAKYCTLCRKDGVKNAPRPVVWSKCWAYCQDCYIRRYPDAAYKRGWIQEKPQKTKRVKVVEPPVVEKHWQPMLDDCFIKQKPINKIGCGCTGILP